MFAVLEPHRVAEHLRFYNLDEIVWASALAAACISHATTPYTHIISCPRFPPPLGCRVCCGSLREGYPRPIHVHGPLPRPLSLGTCNLAWGHLQPGTTGY